MRCLATAALLFLCGVAAGAMSTEEIVKSAIAAGKSAKSQNAKALDDARLASRASQPNAKLHRREIRWIATAGRGGVEVEKGGGVSRSHNKTKVLNRLKGAQSLQFVAAGSLRVCRLSE